MNNKVLEQDWKTSNDVTLEDSALLAIRASNHVAITAGPGAGKTELLAHKAGYLIQTGICPNPKKILAISFKTDAARNLQERVELRYGKKDILQTLILIILIGNMNTILKKCWKP